MNSLSFFFLILSASAARFEVSAGTNPIQKVLELLNELQTKVTNEGEEEQKQFEEFSGWCKDEATAKGYEIKDGKARSEELSAAIEKLTSEIETSVSTIESLAQSISTDEGDLQAATAIRKKEQQDFVTSDAELANTVDMLGRAHGIIEKNMKATGFLQATDVQGLTDVLTTILNGQIISTQNRQQLQSFLQSSSNDGDDDLLLQAAPEPAAYKSKSGAILDTLQDMKEKAEKMMKDGQRAEMTANHNFEMLAQSLKTAIEQAKKDMESTKKAKAASEEAKAMAEGDLSSVSKVLAETEKSMQDLSIDCQEKASSWEESQKSRAAELEALVTAQKIIKEMTGGAEAHAYGLLQLSSKDTVRSDHGIVTLLQATAKQSGDVALAQVAQRVKVLMTMNTGNDVFGKVKGLISEMLDKLVKEAAEEASHKAWCDKEMGESQEQMDDHNSKLDTMNARLDKAAATTAKLTELIATLDSELGELAKSQAMMDKMRMEQKAEFKKVSKELEDGVEGLTMALSVLQEYYATKEEDSFVQQPAVGSHSKAGGEATGIIGMLEVAQSDFSKNLAEERVAEESAQQEYEKVTQENQIMKATKSTELTAAGKQKKSLATRMDELSGDKETEQAELDAVTEYYNSLKPQCIAKAETYEERKERREAEISGLKEALEILDSA